MERAVDRWMERAVDRWMERAVERVIGSVRLSDGACG